MEEGELIELFQGDGVILYFPFVDNQSNPYPLDGHTIEFCIYSSSKKEVILSRPMEIDINNIARIMLKTGDTETLSGNYQYLVRVRNGEQFKRIVAKGQIKFLPVPYF